ncbi:hypothetical protein A3780_21400 [Kosakonia radicincitans]|uniref:hypothetical protein n=1 Tax=Kosakonia radicincitans TaxID=283686 RepID=UPI000903651F|nr:hypothetical protein [Kosakonia radicincitans]APG19994.1 hypothetical protein A3780_21400 [Kosakonia radicincitans]
MTTRYSLIKPWHELQNGMHQAIVRFALEQAETQQCELRICFNNKNHCEQILTKMVGEEPSRKLRNNKEYIMSGQKVTLHSTQTIKKDYPPKAVYLLMFPSPDLLKAVEASNEVAVIIVFTESDSHTEPTDEWSESYSIHELRVE